MITKLKNSILIAAVALSLITQSTEALIDIDVNQVTSINPFPHEPQSKHYIEFVIPVFEDDAGERFFVLPVRENSLDFPYFWFDNLKAQNNEATDIDSTKNKLEKIIRPAWEGHSPTRKVKLFIDHKILTVYFDNTSIDVIFYIVPLLKVDHLLFHPKLAPASLGYKIMKENEIATLIGQWLNFIETLKNRHQHLILTWS